MILWVGEQPALRRDPLFVFNNLAQEEKWVIFFLKDTQWLNKMMMREKLNYLFYKSVVKGMVSREKYGVFQFETLVRPNNDPRIGITFLRKAGTCFDKPLFWNASLSIRRQQYESCHVLLLTSPSRHQFGTRHINISRYTGPEFGMRHELCGET